MTTEDASDQNLSYSIDPWVWFFDRQLNYLPKHFVVCKTPITMDSLKWIKTNTKGRYTLFYKSESVFSESSIQSILQNNSIIFYPSSIPAFEDSSEAVLYELTWS